MQTRKPICFYVWHGGEENSDQMEMVDYTEQEVQQMLQKDQSLSVLRIYDIEDIKNDPKTMFFVLYWMPGSVKWCHWGRLWGSERPRISLEDVTKYADMLTSKGYGCLIMAASEGVGYTVVDDRRGLPKSLIPGSQVYF